MKQINSLGNAADQQQTVTLDDGSTVQLEFFYRAGIQRWFIDVIHSSLTLRGFGLSQGPNILRQWRNLIPFGIAVQAIDLIDPVQITDFQTGRVAVYILSADEVDQVEQNVYAPLPLPQE